MTQTTAPTFPPGTWIANVVASYAQSVAVLPPERRAEVLANLDPASRSIIEDAINAR